MDQVPVGFAYPGTGRTAARWGLGTDAAADIQGLVLSPFTDSPESVAIFLRLADGCGGTWLAALRSAGLITSAERQVDDCGAVALTCSGLRRMRLPDEALASFPAPFQDGMTEPNRSRRLGDDDPHMLRSGTLAWSGGGSEPIDAMLLLYAKNRPEVDLLSAAALAAIAPLGVTEAFSLPLSLHSGAGKDTPPREHFGFADGFSQPLPHDDPKARDKLHGIPVGDVLMGYMNAHDEAAPGPSVAAGPASERLDLAGPGKKSLGKNGSYMVVRQLYQNVAAFRASMAESAADLGDPSITADWMAERVIGRQRDGDVLVPGGSLPAVAGEPDNNFGYFLKDRDGLGCPVGSHIRRANPRDGLAKNSGARNDTLHAVNNHRILRRARKYGLPLAEGAADDGVERGLLFMCLQTDIERQFEFIQQTWLLNPVFGRISQEADPLLGLAGNFTLPADPMRRVAQVKTFVTLVGGEYFFMPSLRALDYLGTLGKAVA